MDMDFAGPCTLVRPLSASYPVSVRQIAALLNASFRRRLTTTPLRFTSPSPPSGWAEDFHLQAVSHARHTRRVEGCPPPPPPGTLPHPLENAPRGLPRALHHPRTQRSRRLHPSGPERSPHLRTLLPGSALNQGAQCQSPTTSRTSDLRHRPRKRLADLETFFP